MDPTSKNFGQKKDLFQVILFFLFCFIFLNFLQMRASFQTSYRQLSFSIVRRGIISTYITPVFLKNTTSWYTNSPQFQPTFHYNFPTTPHFYLKSTDNYPQPISIIIKSRLNISNSILIKLSTHPNLQIPQFYPIFTHQLVSN